MACRRASSKRIAADAGLARVPEYDQISGVFVFLVDDAWAHHHADSISRRAAWADRSRNYRLRTRTVLLLHASHTVDSRARPGGVEGSVWLRQSVALYQSSYGQSAGTGRLRLEPATSIF